MENPIIERIYAKIICDIKTQCWNWTGYLINSGYGRIKINNKMQLVHRFIYQYFYGPLPEDKPCVLHHCDNPKCCNPKHLYAGTKQDNANDKVKRNRSPMGEKCKCTKLTECQVIEIRESKDSQRVIAKRFNVSQMNISYIKNRKSWKHI